LRRHAGFANVIVTIPFCRTAVEAGRVLQVKAESGLQSGEAGLEVCGMREIPSKVAAAGSEPEASRGTG
jgi:pyruvate,water dikinase